MNQALPQDQAKQRSSKELCHDVLFRDFLLAFASHNSEENASFCLHPCTPCHLFISVDPLLESGLTIGTQVGCPSSSMWPSGSKEFTPQQRARERQILHLVMLVMTSFCHVLSPFISFISFTFFHIINIYIYISIIQSIHIIHLAFGRL